MQTTAGALRVVINESTRLGFGKYEQRKSHRSLKLILETLLSVRQVGKVSVRRHG